MLQQIRLAPGNSKKDSGDRSCASCVFSCGGNRTGEVKADDACFVGMLEGALA